MTLWLWLDPSIFWTSSRDTIDQGCYPGSSKLNMVLKITQTGKIPLGGSLIVSMSWPTACETLAPLPSYSLWLAVSYLVVYVYWSSEPMCNVRLERCEGRIHAISDKRRPQFDKTWLYFR